MARSLVAGAVSMTMTLQARAGLARGERDALRGVAGADGPDAVGELLAGGRWPTAFYAPRILNEPIG